MTIKPNLNDITDEMVMAVAGRIFVDPDLRAAYSKLLSWDDDGSDQMTQGRLYIAAALRTLAEDPAMYALLPVSRFEDRP